MLPLMLLLGAAASQVSPPTPPPPAVTQPEQCPGPTQHLTVERVLCPPLPSEGNPACRLL